jgi:type IV pilus assembly protein PilW
MMAAAATTVGMPAARHRGSAGMTLVELLVGMAVGLFVATIAISTFVSTRTLNLVNASTARMGENARLAMDLLHTDLRGSGFAGCWPLGQRTGDDPLDGVQSALGPTFSDGFITAGASGLRGYSGNGTGFSPALSSALAAITGPYAPRLDSDILSVRAPADTAALGLIGTMASATAAPRVAAGMTTNQIAQGDVVLISNCEAATMFQVTEAAPAVTGVLTHGTNLLRTFGTDATVYRLQTRHYYVAKSKLREGSVGAGNAYALWRYTVPAPSGEENPIEVAGGIERLRIRYGVDTDVVPDQNINRYYANAADVPSWDRVLAVRLEMQMAAPEDGTARVKTQDQLATGSPTGPDRRLRTLLSEVVTLRNGAP